MTNEGIFQALGKLFSKAKAYLSKIKGGKEIDAIYQKYVGLIEKKVKETTGIDFKMKSSIEEQVGTQKPAAPAGQKPVAPAGQKPAAPAGQKPVAPAQPASVQKATAPAGQKSAPGEKLKENILNEADDAAPVAPAAGAAPVAPAAPADATQPAAATADPKSTLKKFRQKLSTIQQTLKKYQDLALQEMDKILTKYGGAEKNPQLATLIQNQKTQFQLDFLNTQVEMAKKGGDNALSSKLEVERNKVAKDLSTKMTNLSKVKNVEIDVNGQKYKVGVPYRYKKDDGTIQTIKVLKASKDPSKIMAAYTSGPSKDVKQQFKPENIELNFEPEKGKEYNYYSKDKDEVIKVKVSSGIVNNGLVEVKVGDEGTPFKIYSGALIDIKGDENTTPEVKKEENTTTEVKKEENTLKPEVGKTYKYTIKKGENAGKVVDALVNKIEDNGNVNITVNGKTFAVPVSNLKQA